MSPFLCVYGHICLDQIVSLEKLPEPNTSINITEIKRYFGGTGSNLAAISSSLGVPTALCAYVGSDFPREFRSFLESKKIDMSDVEVMDDYESPTVMVVSDKKQNQIAYVYQGPMKDMERFPVKLNSAKNSEMIHFGTGSPVYYLKAMHALDGSKKIALDPAQEIHNVWNAEKFNEALPYAGTFFCNENELKTALRYTELKTAEDLLDIVDMIVNTRGSEGTVIYTKKETIRIPAVKTKVIDPTGAGDAFRGGFYAGIYRKKSLEESAACGNAAASFILQSNGAVSNIPSWDAVEKKSAEILDLMIR